MKTYLWLPMACLAGFIVGAWSAQDELRAFKNHVKETKENAADNQGGFDAFARIVNIPETARHPRRPRRHDRPISPIAVTNATVKPPAAKKSANANVTNETGAVASTKSPPKRLSPEDLRARIEEAQDLWRTRVDVARAQWKSKLKLGGEPGDAFDAALQEMNERLYDSIATLAEMLSDKDAMTPELGLRLVGETTAILAETYDKIGACAPPELRDEISNIQIGDFIDPGVAMPLINVQDKLNGFGRRGVWRR